MRKPSIRFTAVVLAMSVMPLLPLVAHAAPDMSLGERIDAIDPDVIAWRRYFHEHPELSNREFETAKVIARELRGMGLSVQTGIAHTGVVAVLRGGLPGPTVALRSDMDALPVVEEVDVPFKSTVTTTFDGKDVGVMHACGHDMHMAMLLGTAKLLSQMRGQLRGNVKFIFQPAEEGAPAGEEGGAKMMVEQGVMRDDPAPEAVFGLHVFPQWEVGEIGYRPGAIMASSDDLEIEVTGRQTHGAAPWDGIDPIVASAQVINALQTVTSRQMNLTKAPVVVTIGKIDGGVRGNIIPDSVKMTGTLRALDPAMRTDMQARVTRAAENAAEAVGATAKVTIGSANAYPVTVNDPALTAMMLPTLQRALGKDKVLEVQPMLPAEDFSFYAQEVPGLFMFLGVRTPGSPQDQWAANHSPRFHADEDALKVGVRTLVELVLAYPDAKAAHEAS